ncbi:MAG: ketoacyl-ACP synthase III [Eubacteriaceae bacterium]|mgnify:CR=1 FL=1|jgi:3-oxoacyl-[acyl-carrier-protein] synthase-3|nr:ketoacyl-ACP synthase III [Eubacteriaceae bacterium]
MNFEILGTGSYVPEHVVTNEDLSKIVDTSDEWITERTGIRQRRIAVAEATHDLAYEAAKAALADANVEPNELDMILCATISSDLASPSTAIMVQKMLGATCPAMDISAACSGFVYTLDVAAGFFARGKVKKMLVIGAERLSKMLDWEDRTTCVIFADGAGAVVLGEGEAYLSSKLTTKGDDDVIKIPNHIGISPFSTLEEEKPCINMKGREVFKFAVNAMCNDVKEVLEQAGLNQQDVSYVIPHQANLRIIDSVRRKMEIAPEKYCHNIEKYGNTSSASIPLVLDELNKEGKLKTGDYLVFSAFGGGLTTGACVIQWTK